MQIWDVPRNEKIIIDLGKFVDDRKLIKQGHVPVAIGKSELHLIGGNPQIIAS